MDKRSKQQICKTKYYECSKLVPTEQTATVENGEIKLEITLDPHAVVFYEIKPDCQ